MARLILTVSFLASVLLSIALGVSARAEDSWARVVSNSEEQGLRLVLDGGIAPEESVPPGRSRGYWVEPLPPPGFKEAVSKGDRFVYRIRQIRALTWTRTEYRVQKGSETLVFSHGKPLAFWGPLIMIGAAPLLLGGLAAGIAAIAGAIASRTRRAG